MKLQKNKINSLTKSIRKLTDQHTWWNLFSLSHIHTTFVTFCDKNLNSFVVCVVTGCDVCVLRKKRNVARKKLTNTTKQLFVQHYKQQTLNSETRVRFEIKHHNTIEKSTQDSSTLPQNITHNSALGTSRDSITNKENIELAANILNFNDCTNAYVIFPMKCF